MKKAYKESLKSIERLIEKGSTLEEAFLSEKEIFPQFFISMVGIGEKTGKIIYVFKGLELYYKKVNFIKEKTKSSLTYPALVLVALILLGFFVVIFFIPTMANIYSSIDDNMPKVYINVLKFNYQLRENTIGIMLYIIFWGFILPRYILKNYLSQYIKRYIYKIPICYLINEYISIVLISVIVNSGINISTGLGYCSKGEFINKINYKIANINKDIIQGKTLTEAMKNTDLFSKYTLAHIRLGEESGALDKRLSLLEAELFDKLSNKIDKILVWIQPTFIGIMAVPIVAFILIFIMPIFEVISIGV